MDTAILKMNFPLGSLPVRGFRCPVCGEEEVLARELATAQDLAHRLGLFGTENRRTRKLHRHGNSVTVTLDPDFLRRHRMRAGDTVVVAQRGDELVIRPEAHGTRSKRKGSASKAKV